MHSTRLWGAPLNAAAFDSWEQKIWGHEGVHPWLLLWDQLRQKFWLGVHWSWLHLQEGLQPHNIPVWTELGLTLNWLLGQENNFVLFLSHCYLMFVLTWKWYTVSSGWARGLFLVCQATLMMGIKSWGTASQLDRKPTHRVLVGLGIFFFYPQMEKSWHGAQYNRDLECSKKKKNQKWSGSNRWAEKRQSCGCRRSSKDPGTRRMTFTYIKSNKGLVKNLAFLHFFKHLSLDTYPPENLINPLLPWEISELH